MRSFAYVTTKCLSSLDRAKLVTRFVSSALPIEYLKIKLSLEGKEEQEKEGKEEHF